MGAVKSRPRHSQSTRRVKSLGRLTSKSVRRLTARRNSELAKPKIRETLSQGDCFYSAIYRACSEQKLLHKFEDPIDASDEVKFVVSMREMVADNIKGEIEGFFDNAIGYLNSPSDYDGLPAFALTLVKQYVKDKNPKINKYVDKYLAKVKTRGSYSGEFEVRATVNFLNFIGIELDIRYLNEERNGDPMVLKPNKIYIVNEYEGHYEFFSFKKDSNYPLSDYSKNSRPKGFQPGRYTRKRS